MSGSIEPEKTLDIEGSAFKALNKITFIQARKSLSRWGGDNVRLRGETNLQAKPVRLAFARRDDDPGTAV